VARAEYGSAVTTAVLLGLLGIVSWLRWRGYPIGPRRVGGALAADTE
jgi:hypothetical protein